MVREAYWGRTRKDLRAACTIAKDNCLHMYHVHNRGRTKARQHQIAFDCTDNLLFLSRLSDIETSKRIHPVIGPHALGRGILTYS